MVVFVTAAAADWVWIVEYKLQVDLALYVCVHMYIWSVLRCLSHALRNTSIGMPS